jgi:hypothetical protein
VTTFRAALNLEIAPPRKAAERGVLSARGTALPGFTCSVDFRFAIFETDAGDVFCQVAGKKGVPAACMRVAHDAFAHLYGGTLARRVVRLYGKEAFDKLMIGSFAPGFVLDRICDLTKAKALARANRKYEFRDQTAADIHRLKVAEARRAHLDRCKSLTSVMKNFVAPIAAPVLTSEAADEAMAAAEREYAQDIVGAERDRDHATAVARKFGTDSKLESHAAHRKYVAAYKAAGERFAERRKTIAENQLAAKYGVGTAKDREQHMRRWLAITIAGTLEPEEAEPKHVAALFWILTGSRLR